MFRKILGLSIVILMCTLSAHAQGTIDKNGVYHPTEEEIARNKQIAELLKHPTFVILRLASSPRDVPRESGTDTPAPYKVKDYIGFELFITQNSSETLRLGITSSYYDYRPELMKDGQSVSYSESAAARVNRAENYPYSGSVFGITVKTGEEQHLGFINFDEWYDPLTPGRYQLTVRKQFALDGDWVVSNPVYFEVVPRTPGSPIPPGVTIELTLEGVQPKADGKPYQLGNEVFVNFLVRNKSDQPLKINVIDREYGNQPHLFKNGVLIPYREDLAATINLKEENPRLVAIVNNFFLDPKVGTWPDGLDLTKWYGKLSPGSYRLVIRHRFEIDGPWSEESAPLLFEIPAPKRP